MEPAPDVKAISRLLDCHMNRVTAALNDFRVAGILNGLRTGDTEAVAMAQRILDKRKKDQAEKSKRWAASRREEDEVSTAPKNGGRGKAYLDDIKLKVDDYGEIVSKSSLELLTSETKLCMWLIEKIGDLERAKFAFNNAVKSLGG